MMTKIEQKQATAKFFATHKYKTDRKKIRKNSIT